MGQEASAFEPAYYETLIWLFFCCLVGIGKRRNLCGNKSKSLKLKRFVSFLRFYGFTAIQTHLLLQIAFLQKTILL